MNGPDPIRARWRELIDRHLLDELSNDESRELEAALAAHREAREEFRLRCNVDAALRQEATALAGETPAPAARSSNGHTSVAPQWFSWLAWRPLTAAAAGIVIGLFCATVAWAVTSHRAVATAERLFALVDGGFENDLAGAGFPKQTGAWSGDAAEVVVADGVPAREGRRLLRFVKAEGDANATDGRALACDVFQLVDLRPLRANLGAEGNSLLELSASFLDARPTNTKPSVTFFCQIYLFKGDAANVHQAWPGNLPEAIASGSAEVTTLGGNGDAWRQLTAKSLVSSEADFAVVQISARPNLRVPMPPHLFVDDVKLTLRTQPNLPVRVVKR